MAAEPGTESSHATGLRLLQAAAVALTAAALTFAAAGAFPRITGRAEALTWDLRAAHLAAPGPTTGRIQLIFLDQYSLDWGAQRGWTWPWPRQVYGAILDFCARGRAKSVAFDVIFSEPSGIGVDDDAEFGKAIAASGRYVGAVFVSDDRHAGSATWPTGFQASPLSLAAAGDTPPPGFTLPRASFPIPEVATNAALLATVFGNPDPDGIYRRLRPFSLFDGRLIPSLGLGAWLAGTSNTTATLTPSGLAIGNTTIPLDRDGCAILRYRGPSQTHPVVNVTAVIESEMLLREGKAPLIDPATLKDKHVLFGFTAPGLFDLKSAPVAAVYPGVEVHATFLDNLLASDFIREAPRGWTVCATLLFSLVAAVAVRLGRHAWQNGVAFAVILLLPPLAGAIAYTHGIWMPVAVPLAATALALTGALAVNFATEGRQKRFIKGAFRQYLSPVVIEELVQHPERLKLGGESRELSIFFSDVRGFTGISERLNPQELTGLLNDYLTAMTDII